MSCIYALTPEVTVLVEDHRNFHRFICVEFLAETVPWESMGIKIANKVMDFTDSLI